MSRRIAAIAESATLKVDAKAKALKAQGRPIISYAAGEPNFATPAHIVQAASEAVQDPKNYKYTPAAGLPELREAVAAKTLRDSGLAVSAAQVVITNGGKQAVYQSFATLFTDWRVFNHPGIVKGRPEYSAAAMAKKAEGLAAFRARL